MGTYGNSKEMLECFDINYGQRTHFKDINFPYTVESCCLYTLNIDIEFRHNL